MMDGDLLFSGRKVSVRKKQMMVSVPTIFNTRSQCKENGS